MAKNACFQHFCDCFTYRNYLKNNSSQIQIIGPRILLREDLCFWSRTYVSNAISQSQISETLWNLAQRLLIWIARDSQRPIFDFCKKGVNIAEKGVKKHVFRWYWGILTTDFFYFLICYSWWYIESLCKKAKKSGANKASNKQHATQVPR